MPDDNITTIKINEKTKERLDKLKEHEKESYDYVTNKLLNIMNICSKNPVLASRILKGILKNKERSNLINNSVIAGKIYKNKAETSMIEESINNAKKNMQRAAENFRSKI